MRYGLHLCFHGSSFAGWQRQKNAPSIQQSIEDALAVLLKTPAQLTGCGRTDSGVHALNFFAHFDVESSIADINVMLYQLNAILPSGIRIFEIFPASDDWNARFSATSRTYRYFIHLNKNPFRQQTSWNYNRNLNLRLMQEAADFLLGKHDFTSFAKLHGGQKTGFCEVSSFQVWQEDESVVIEISADRFLRNMVRALTGTLLDIGSEKMEPHHILSILNAGNRSTAGASVPAHGLFLWKVTYGSPADGFVPHNKNLTNSCF